MSPKRRTLLKSFGGVTALGVGIHLLKSNETPTIGTAVGSIIRQQVFDGPGAAVAADVTDGLNLGGFSDEVSVRAVSDPANPGQGRGGRDGVLQITSIPGNRGGTPGRGNQGQGQGNDGDDETSGEAETWDYGISIVNVEGEGLTVADVASADGSGEELAYDWYVTEQDVTAVGTENEMSGVGPDEVWLALVEPGEGDEGTPSGGTDSGVRARSLDRIPVFIFRTMYADEGTGEWHTRSVADELGVDGDPSWREVSVDSREFTDMDQSPLEAYGEYEIRAVGVGRGDPFFGPSILDSYYSNFRMAGQSYPLPVTANAAQRNPGRGNQ